MLGTIEAYRRADGQCEIRRADPLVGMSLALVVEALAGTPWLSFADGMFTISGVDQGGSSVQHRYRAVGFQSGAQPGDAPPEVTAETLRGLQTNEGGFLLLELLGVDSRQ